MIDQIQIPNKSHFRPDEVCNIIGVKPYVLRYWESEFDQINAISSSDGHKLFTHDDLEAIVKIKSFLFDENMTIENAKMQMDKDYELSNQESDLDEFIPRQKAFVREVSESDIQKLIMAKEKLSDILSLTNTLKGQHNWQ